MGIITTRIPVVILELIRDLTSVWMSLIRLGPSLWKHRSLVIHNKVVNRMAYAGDIPPEFLTYQLDGRVLSYRGIDE